MNMALIALSLLGGPACAKALDFGDAVPNIQFIVFVPAFLAIGIVVLCFVFHAYSGEGGALVKPDLHENLFVPLSERPLQIFWMNGHVMAAMGLGSFLYGLIVGDRGWEWVFFACVASGCYIGVRLAMLMFKIG